MECPHCHSDKLIKKGSYKIASATDAVQKFQCKSCGKYTSESWWSPEYRLRKREFTNQIFHTLCQGVSQRACARLFGVKREAIAIRLELFGECAAANLAYFRQMKSKSKVIILDEMESFEQSKCKPLTIPLLVEDKTRLILSLKVGSIAAKGPLAEISRKKYGKRFCERKIVLAQALGEVKECFDPDGLIKSDQSPHYQSIIRKQFPGCSRKVFKGRKPKAHGLGELKKGGFDPLFSLNHTAAMIRDHIKRMARKTWATTKKAANLELALLMYAWFHNMTILDPKAKVSLSWVSRDPDFLKFV